MENIKDVMRPAISQSTNTMKYNEENEIEKKNQTSQQFKYTLEGLTSS